MDEGNRVSGRLQVRKQLFSTKDSIIQLIIQSLVGGILVPHSGA